MMDENLNFLKKVEYVYVCLKIEYMLVRIWISKFEIHVFLVEVIEKCLIYQMASVSTTSLILDLNVVF